MRQIFILLLISATANGQSFTSLFADNSQKGDKYFNEFSYIKAISAYEKALEKDAPDSVGIRLKIAESYRLLNDPAEAATWYASALNKDTIADSRHLLHYAEALSSLERYEEAKEWYSLYDKQAEQDKRGRIKAEGISNKASFFKNVDKVKTQKAEFNSGGSDFGPAWYEDNLVFVSARKATRNSTEMYNWDNTPYLDLYLLDGEGAVSKFQKDINSKYHEGPSVFYDSANKMVFTRNNYQGGRMGKSEEGIMKLKLYYAEKEEDGQWSKPISLPFNSDEYSVGHPAITTDGTTLYFASDMPGGMGGTDIYKVENLDGVWQTPENLGNGVNTEGNELFPFLHNNQHLYFASNGHEGLGGLDIFGCDLNNGRSAKIINLGAPINSHLDDFGIILNDHGRQGYFATNREESRSHDDIYSFTSSVDLLKSYTLSGTVYDQFTKSTIPGSKVSLMDKAGKILETTTSDENGNYSFNITPEQAYELKAVKNDYLDTQQSVVGSKELEDMRQDLYLAKSYAFQLMGLILEKITLMPIDSVHVTLVDNFTGEEVLSGYTSPTGKFLYDMADKVLNDRISYQIHLEKRGYLGKSATFNDELKTPGVTDLTEKLDLNLDKIEIGTDIGKLVDIKPIYFDLGKHNIRPDAAVELDKIVTMMKDNSDISIELGSHTDARGSESSNMSLSDRRAKSSASYIISQGINADRIVGRGYGEARLLNRCADGVKCSEAEHQINRRTEFKITKY